MEFTEDRMSGVNKIGTNSKNNLYDYELSKEGESVFFSLERRFRHEQGK